MDIAPIDERLNERRVYKIYGRYQMKRIPAVVGSCIQICARGY